MDIKFMKVALREALKAAEKKEVPVGAVIVKDNMVLAKAHNLREQRHDATAHAEVLAIKKACQKLKRWNLSDCELYVTLEPCVMCSGAIVYSRIKNVYYGAYDKRFGCCGSVYNLASDERFNHRASIMGGILEEECKKLIVDFFAQLRQNN